MITPPIRALVAAFLLTSACTPASKPTDAAEGPQPEVPAFTAPREVTRGSQSQASQPFRIAAATLVATDEARELRVVVRTVTPASPAEYTLYWNGITTRSIPPRASVVLHRSEIASPAHTKLQQTLRFGLDGLPDPVVLTVVGHDGQRLTLEVEANASTQPRP